MRILSMVLILGTILAQDLKPDEPLGRNVTSAEMLDVIIERIMQKQESLRTEVVDMKFLAHSVFRETNADGRFKKEIIIDRFVLEKGDKQVSQYLSMSVNGVSLNEKEMEQEIADWEKKGKRRGTTHMPFDPRYRDDYEYRLISSSDGIEVPTWQIGFDAKKAEDGYLNGIALVRKDYQIIRIEATPAKTPGVIKDMKMIYTYGEDQGYWLPETFEFSLRLKVKFVLTFVHNMYTLEDCYSQFILNSDLPDSLFTEHD